MSDLRFSEELLDRIRAAVPITGLIGQYVEWDRAKSQPTRGDMWACCPFHGESAPSFHADNDKGVYHCFGCGVHGDHFKFLTEHVGMTFPEAVRHVAEACGVEVPGVPSDGPAQPAEPPEQPREETAPPQPSATDIKPVLVKEYNYTGRDPDDLLYQVTRWQKPLPSGGYAKTKDGKGTWKTFLQRRPDGAGRWIWGLSAGEFMRKPGGDWRSYNADKFTEGMETRFFDAGAQQTIFRHPAVEIAIAEGKTVLITEGEKDAETAVDLGYCGTTNSSGSKHWQAYHAECFRDADVVICLDNDEAGQRAEKLATSMKGIARRIRVLDFGKIIEGFPQKGDITDWREQFGGTAEQLLQIVQGLPDWRPAPPKSSFNAAHVGEVEERRRHRRHDWLVQDFIEAGGVCSFSGMSQAGKTFAVTELAFCIASGKPFFGRPVKQGLVIYQVGEGELGFEKRLDGYAKDRGIDLTSVPFIYWPRKVNLFVDEKDTEAMIAEAKLWAAYHDMPIAMLVIDTFNKATRGANEISGQDMGKVINNTERLSAELGCTTVVIDHLNKSGDLRGHGSKAMDITNSIKVITSDKVDQNGRKIRRMVLDKNKDGENGQSISFVLRQVVVGEDQNGRQETTCVVEAPDGNENEIIASGRLPVGMATLLRMVKDAADIEGEAAPPELVQVPPGRNVAKWDAVVARFRRNWTFTASEQKAKDKEVARVLADAGRRLLLAGYIGRDNDKGLIWWTGKEDRIRKPNDPKPVEKPKPSPLMTPEDMQVPF